MCELNYLRKVKSIDYDWSCKVQILYNSYIKFNIQNAYKLYYYTIQAIE